MDAKQLIERYLLGIATRTETDQLDQLLADDPELRREFVKAANLDAGMRELAQQRLAEPDLVEAKRGRFGWAGLLTLAVAASLLVAVGMFAFSPTPVATLESSENAAWESDLPTKPGAKLTPGILDLKAGVATIRFESGAEVVLEAPAALELIDPMRGRLIAGAATIDVPESAHGFVIETHDGFAVDYGTKFAVKIDDTTKHSDFELIEGEIAVHHGTAGDEVRLTDEGKTATLADTSIVLGHIESEVEEEVVLPTPKIVRIGTDGRTGSAVFSNKHKFIDPEVLSVKKSNSGKWDHRSFFAFDFSGIDFDRVESVRLRLNQVPSHRGSKARLPKVNRFSIYGLTNVEKDNWQPRCRWNDSPGPEDGVFLAAFEIPRSKLRGSVQLQTDELFEFLKNDADKAVTLILVRDTTNIEGVGPGYMHMFASDSHPESVGPLLEFSMID